MHCCSLTCACKLLHGTQHLSELHQAQQWVACRLTLPCCILVPSWTPSPQVPWSKLGTEPVVAEFDRLYVVASPRQDDSSKGSCPQSVDDAIAAAQAAEQAAKRQRVDTAEDTWLKVRGQAHALYTEKHEAVAHSTAE